MFHLKFVQTLGWKLMREVQQNEVYTIVFGRMRLRYKLPNSLDSSRTSRLVRLVLVSSISRTSSTGTSMTTSTAHGKIIPPPDGFLRFS